jgi:hypothetical protein
LPRIAASRRGPCCKSWQYALLDRAAFLKGLQFERQHYATGHAGMDGDAAGFYAGYLATHEGLLIALAVVAVAAVAMCHRQRWRVAVVLGSFPIIYSAVVAMQAVRNDRTIMLVLPPLAVLAALAIEPLMTTYAQNHRAVGLATATAVAVLVVEAVVRLPYPPPSTWNSAQHWLDEHTPSGTTVLIEPYGPWLNSARYKVIPCGRVIDCAPPRGGYVVASEGMYGRFTEEPKTYPVDAAAYQRLFRQLPQVAISGHPRFQGARGVGIGFYVQARGGDKARPPAVHPRTHSVTLRR